MDLYSTNRLIALVEDLRSRPAPISLLSTFFPTVIEETSEEIHFDSSNKPRRIAPFVSPLAQGKLVESLGFATQTFKPAYVKDKRVFDGNRPLKRVMGESLTGSLSPEQRVQVLLAAELADQIAMIRRRKEIMAAEALRLGQVTVSGEDYPTKVVSFGRDASLTIDLSGGAAEWDDAGVSPIENLESWLELVLKLSGSVPTDLVFTPTAWKLLRADAKFEKSIDLLRGGTTNVELGPKVGSGLILRGTFSGVTRLWNYYDWYIDDNGVEQPVLPDNWVIGGSASIEGAQCQGAIRDHGAGFRAMEFFAKSWTIEDPSVRYLMTQSAPLVVPFRPNASFAAKVT